MVDYPYVLSNKRIENIILSLQAAVKPARFTLEFLKNLGYASTNDRAVVKLFKKLEFLAEDGTPTQYYDQLRDNTTYKRILASRMRELYSELFSINTTIYSDTADNIKGAISRVTGGDEKAVIRVYNTFKELAKIADFKALQVKTEPSSSNVADKDEEKRPSQDTHKIQSQIDSIPPFHYNIQIHLPATTDISVYNAIFKSLKDNLII